MHVAKALNRGRISIFGVCSLRISSFFPFVFVLKCCFVYSLSTKAFDSRAHKISDLDQLFLGLLQYMKHEYISVMKYTYFKQSKAASEEPGCGFRSLTSEPDVRVQQ